MAEIYVPYTLTTPLGTISFNPGNPDGGAPMFNGGNSMCTGTCDFNYTPGSGGAPSTIKTRLCSIDDDCTSPIVPA